MAIWIGVTDHWEGMSSTHYQTHQCSSPGTTREELVEFLDMYPYLFDMFAFCATPSHFDSRVASCLKRLHRATSFCWGKVYSDLDALSPEAHDTLFEYYNPSEYGFIDRPVNLWPKSMRRGVRRVRREYNKLWKILVGSKQYCQDV